MEADTAQNPTANHGRTRPARSYADGQDGRDCRTPWQVNQLLTERLRVASYIEDIDIATI